METGGACLTQAAESRIASSLGHIACNMHPLHLHGSIERWADEMVRGKEFGFSLARESQVCPANFLFGQYPSCSPGVLTQLDARIKPFCCHTFSVWIHDLVPCSVMVLQSKHTSCVCPSSLVVQPHSDTCSMPCRLAGWPGSS